MKTLSGLSLKEIEEITDELKASKFRARQIHNWIYLKSVKEIDEMTDLSVKFREELKQIARVTDVKIKVKQVSSDGTIKYLPESLLHRWNRFLRSIMPSDAFQAFFPLTFSVPLPHR